MGTWSVSVTGNDTAQDLLSEYTAAFYKYEPEEAVKKIENYVRTNMFDESDEEEWCYYFYSLADFMWKKGILTKRNIGLKCFIKCIQINFMTDFANHHPSHFGSCRAAADEII